LCWQVLSFQDRSTADQARVIVGLVLLAEQLERYLMQAMLAKEQQEDQKEQEEQQEQEQENDQQ
jgi:hypothetical protein